MHDRHGGEYTVSRSFSHVFPATATTHLLDVHNGPLVRAQQSLVPTHTASDIRTRYVLKMDTRQSDAVSVVVVIAIVPGKFIVFTTYWLVS